MGDSRELSIILRLKDEVSSQLSGMKSSIDSLRPQFAAAAAIGTVAFASVSAEIYSATDAARESIKIHNQLNAVLRSTGSAAGVTADMADKLSNAMQDVTSYDNDAVLSAENILLTFTKINKDIFPQTTELVLDMSAALGQDLKGSAIQLGKALQDPVLGMTALRRVGVSFTEDQIAVVKSLVETGQQAQAQALILDEITKEFGGSARATADPVVQLTNTIDDLQKEIGRALIPVLNDVVLAIKPVLEVVMQWVEAHPKLTAAILIATGALFGLVAVVGTLGLAIPAIIAGFTLMTGTVGVVIGIIVALIATVSELISIFYILKDDSALIVAGLKAYWQEFKDWFVKLWASIEQYFADVWEGIKAYAADAIDSIVAKFQPLISLFNTVKSGLSSIGSAASSVGGFIGNAVHAVIPHLATGGVVSTPTVALIGESGPEAVVPLNRMGAMGSITVNINGGTYLDQHAAELLGNKLAEVLKFNLKLA